jgi:hypothetical protein
MGMNENDSVTEQSKGNEAPSLSHAEVTQLWAQFRAGETILCVKDAHGIALAVDGAAKSYRLVCTKCGLSSPWFGTSPSGVLLHNLRATGRNGLGL